MSSTASDYDVGRLYAGIGLAVLATLAGLATASRGLLKERTTGLWIFSITIIYGVMMFASSYVEEEHHFWYWTTSAWLAWLFVKQ